MESIVELTRQNIVMAVLAVFIIGYAAYTSLGMWAIFQVTDIGGVYKSGDVVQQSFNLINNGKLALPNTTDTFAQTYLYKGWRVWDESGKVWFSDEVQEVTNIVEPNGIVPMTAQFTINSSFPSGKYIIGGALYSVGVAYDESINAYVQGKAITLDQQGFSIAISTPTVKPSGFNLTNMFARIFNWVRALFGFK